MPWPLLPQRGRVQVPIKQLDRALALEPLVLLDKTATLLSRHKPVGEGGEPKQQLRLPPLCERCGPGPEETQRLCVQRPMAPQCSCAQAPMKQLDRACSLKSSWQA